MERMLWWAAGIGAIAVIAVLGVNMYTKNAPQGCSAEAKLCPDGTAVGRTGPQCEFAPCPNGDAMFDRTGVATFGNPGANGAVFIYEEPGKPALSKQLAFDAQSMCVTPGGTIVCLAMSVPLDLPFGGKRVRVIGIDRGADLLVRRLELSASTTPANVTVHAKLGEHASALGVTLTPLEIVEDSRCPIDVQCIQAGTVRVRVRAESGLGTSILTLELGHSATTEAELVTLTEVQPEKRAAAAIRTSDYRLTFEVAQRLR